MGFAASVRKWRLKQDKTKQQTRDFLRQALQEEIEYDPECTFQPQISEMSELIMRKYSRYDFHERNRLWSGRKQSRLEKLRNTRVDQETYPFTPNIIADPPKFKPGAVEKKQGVKSYLDKIARRKMIDERDRILKERRQPKGSPSLRSTLYQVWPSSDDPRGAESQT